MQKSCFPGGRKHIETKSQWSSVSQHWDHAFENDNSFRVTTPSSNCCKLCDLLFRQKRALRFSSASTSHKSHRHITTTGVRTFEAKGFAANVRNGLRFNLADVGIAQERVGGGYRGTVRLCEGVPRGCARRTSSQNRRFHEV